MSTIIGIDIGGSTTKIVGMRDGTLFGKNMVKAGDPITSAYGAFGKLLTENHLNLSQVDRVMCTGVGSAFLKEDIYDIPTQKVDEFMAIGLGGRYISGLDHCIVVSMGTGTAFTCVQGEDIHHLGGTGVGGGTILGLCKKLAGTGDYRRIVKLAAAGKLDEVDLTIGDITEDQLSNMMAKTTASNFGKVQDSATAEDFCMGVVNLVLQTIGIIAQMAAKANGMERIVLTGNLSQMSIARPILNELEELYDVSYLVPEHSDFATAIGCALCGNR